MILNRASAALIKRPPQLSLDWQNTLEEWLATALAPDFPNVFELQFKMLESVISIEQKIRASQEERKTKKIKLPQLKAAHDVSGLRETQSIVSSLEEQISMLQYLRECVLFVGDTIASKFLDVDSVKHMAAFQSPGFLSGKDGLDEEIYAAKHFYQDGWMVLFNDLTHSLRVGDLTLKKGEITKTFEVKASSESYASEEAARQIVTPMLIHQFIKNDWSPFPSVVQENTDIAKKGTIAHGATRVSSGIEENWHFDVPGDLFRTIRRSDVAVVRRGCKTYLAARQRHLGALSAAVNEATSVGDWIAGSLRTRVTDYGELPPFSRWLKPYSTVEVVSGSMVIVTAISLQGLEALFAERKVEIEWQSKSHDLLPIKFTSKAESDPDWTVQQVNVCNWHRLRMLYAFLSAETFVEICSFMLSPAAIKQVKEKRKH